MNDIAGKMDMIASTPESMLPGFGLFEQAFIRAVKRFRETEKNLAGKHRWQTKGLTRETKTLQELISLSEIKERGSQPDEVGSNLQCKYESKLFIDVPARNGGFFITEQGDRSVRQRRWAISEDYVEDDDASTLPGCIGETHCDESYLECGCRVRRQCEQLCAELYPGGETKWGTGARA